MCVSYSSTVPQACADEETARFRKMEVRGGRKGDEMSARRDAMGEEEMKRGIKALI
jgi:hypothetical protein